MKHEEGLVNAMQLLATQVRDWYSSLEPDQLALLQAYAELLASYNQANVIGTKDLQSVVLDHILDSLSATGVEEVHLDGRLIDVGSGGGLPGLPLAIVSHKLDVTLLESIEKKVAFLRHAREQLQLSNVAVLNERAEDAGKQGALRDSYDIATSRALASLPVVVEYCAPFVREGGWILAMKGRLDEEELTAGERAARKLGAELSCVTRVVLRPELEQKQRQIVVFRKTAPTPTGYPRRVGLAKKRPLGL